ncbi:hypothetical protein H257_03872 [Aphanomyces astaci]|uniref:Serine-threonine/tyrosine-protein kinase catalytic domain-containing protein n=1 Tax=Aphanomyces astaci TaxID=112090 RepID=W4GYH1_APHAT|nr:hypothetical protein H257_03872 [Aphanomyces astaci]ETV84775.1 hypothetical protein H257_03872 [Aphanomyces astaci]|eukprot:XP_009826467.1 hypothetical protein H257_03872 [Aphanomyces astaci]
MAGFSSPYIVEFVGASWGKPIDLAYVLELCMDLGGLRDYLGHQNPRDFQWQDKLTCIYSTVEGLTLGWYTEHSTDTMTLGVCMYRWMAPLILEYNHYSVAADIFRTVCFCPEFSTHQLPYCDRTNYRDYWLLIDTAIMVVVVSGIIHPTFSNMPGLLNDLALECIDFEPRNRPSVRDGIYNCK